MGLTARQQAFVNEYLTCWNASEAARRAGYSERTANEQGSRLLANVSISDEIQRRVSEMTTTADEVLVRLTSHARGSMDDFLEFDESGQPTLDLNKARMAGKLGVVRKFNETEVTHTAKNGDTFTTKRVNIELYPADGALDKLMRYHGLYNDKLSITWQQEVLDLLSQGRITREDVFSELGSDLAAKLFKSAGVPAASS